MTKVLELVATKIDNAINELEEAKELLLSDFVVASLIADLKDTIDALDSIRYELTKILQGGDKE